MTTVHLDAPRSTRIDASSQKAPLSSTSRRFHTSASNRAFRRLSGSGNGPRYTAPGVVYHVTGSDPYRLDADHDHWGCE